jgi:hypothetical protein
MKLQLKIVLISFVIAIVGGCLVAWGDGTHRMADYFVNFGVVAFFGGLLQIIVGLVLLAMTDKRYAQGFLISGGLLMLVGFVTCSGSFGVH